MAHLFQFSKNVIVNLDGIETIILNIEGNNMREDKLQGLILLNQADEHVAYKSLDDPTTEETWNRLKKIAAPKQGI